MNILFILYTLFHLQLVIATDECLTWFSESKIESGSTCVLKCSSLKTDMATFTCPEKCDTFCKPYKKSPIIAGLTDLYPGLTDAEKDLAAKEPVKVLASYKLSWEAESICQNIYSSSKTNDESDACRHFIWAALLVNDFGKVFTEKILDAHEQEPSQPEEEKAMDLSNNRRGLSVAEDLIEHKNFDKKKILESFQNELKNGNLIILRKRAGVKK